MERAASPVVEFWFEFASTYSYPAAFRVEPAAAERGIRVLWRPFLLGPIFRDQGWNDSPFNVYPVKGRYMWRDLERICQAQALPLVRPSQFPRNGLLAARVACRFSEEAWLPGFVRAVYRANFVEDRDISDAEVLARCLEGVGVDAGPTLRDARTREAKDALREQTQRATALGIFGAPSFRAGPELFWGHDRLEQALDWAASGSAARPGG